MHSRLYVDEANPLRLDELEITTVRHDSPRPCYVPVRTCRPALRSPSSQRRAAMSMPDNAPFLPPTASPPPTAAAALQVALPLPRQPLQPPPTAAGTATAAEAASRGAEMPPPPPPPSAHPSPAAAAATAEASTLLPAALPPPLGRRRLHPRHRHCRRHLCHRSRR